MKKVIFLIIALLMVVSLPMTKTFAHTEDEPSIVDLLAGQTEDIGDIEVWNDGEMLYVSSFMMVLTAALWKSICKLMKETIWMIGTRKY